MSQVILYKVVETKGGYAVYTQIKASIHKISENKLNTCTFGL